MANHTNSVGGGGSYLPPKRLGKAPANINGARKKSSVPRGYQEATLEMQQVVNDTLLKYCSSTDQLRLFAGGKILIRIENGVVTGLLLQKGGRTYTAQFGDTWYATELGRAKEQINVKLAENKKAKVANVGALAAVRGMDLGPGSYEVAPNPMFAGLPVDYNASAEELFPLPDPAEEKPAKQVAIDQQTELPLSTANNLRAHLARVARSQFSLYGSAAPEVLKKMEFHVDLRKKPETGKIEIAAVKIKLNGKIYTPENSDALAQLTEALRESEELAGN